METEHKVSTWKIITNDMVTYHASMVLVLVLVVYLMAALSRTSALPIFSVSAIVVILAAMTIITLRVMKIKSVLVKGQTLNGVVTSKGFRPGQGNLSLNFMIEGKPFKSSASTPITKFSSNLKAGDKITLIVDPRNPKLALLKELFVK